MTAPVSPAPADFDAEPFSVGGAPGGGSLLSADAAAAPPARKRSKVAVIFALSWLAFASVMALAADWLPIANPTDIPTSEDVHYLQAPGVRLREPLGTDVLGRSEVSRVIFGARTSLGIGVAATLAGLCVGTVLGLVGGYLRGIVDSVIDIATTTMLVFPPLVFLIALVAVLKPGVSTLILALAVLSVPLFARVSRAHTIGFRNREFVVAARAMGGGKLRVMFGEILPNVMLPMLSYATLVAAVLIVAESGLSYLGLGVRPPAPSWGKMIADGFQFVRTKPHLVLVPAFALLLTVFSLNVLGDWARARFGRAGGR